MVRGNRSGPGGRRYEGRSGLIALVLALVGVGSGCTATLPIPIAASGFSSTLWPTPAPTPSGTSTYRRAPQTTRQETPARTAPRTSTSASSCPSPCLRVGEAIELPAGVAPEASGLASSASRPGVWFTVDDATGTSEVIAVDLRGRLLGRIPVTGMSARNAEALASGPCGAAAGAAGRCLYVGDIGDNDQRRADIVIYQLAEPVLPRSGPVPAPRPILARAWHYTYPDGRHDAESLVVAPDGSLVIITKSHRTGLGPVAPHRIYRGRPGGGRLVLVSTFVPPEPSQRVQSLITGTVVTDATLTGSRLLLLTYDEVVEYRAPSASADPAGFPRWPHRELADPGLIQQEGISGAADGCGYVAASEEGPDGHRSALATINCTR